MRSMLPTISLVSWAATGTHPRRIVGQVEEERDALQTAVLLEVSREEPCCFQIHTHRGEHDGEVLLVAVVHALVCDTLLLDEAGLPTDLGGDFVVR